MKGYRDNGAGRGGFGARSKTVYDDVFGGPPKFGATTLPPRIEDYTEIFQGFHASRCSSIPVLDLPPPSVESDDVWFDVSSSKLDYSEVFGGFNGLDFAYSYEELFESSKVGDDDSSDDVWTPAQSESLSDESDPNASIETNQQVFTADANQSHGTNLKNEPDFEADKDSLNGMTNDSQSFFSKKTETENFFLPVNNNNLCESKDLGKVSEGKKLKKSLSQPLDRPLVSVSGLSLKTQPSNLPPPSRPPPALTSKKGDFGNFNSKLKTSKSYAFDRMTVDQSPPFFDVEIDASSSAAADAAAMKDAVEQAQAKLKSVKALMGKKKKVKENENYEKLESFEGEKMKRLFESDSGVTMHEVRDENQQNVGSTESKNNNNIVFEYFEQKEDSEIVQEPVYRSQKKDDSDENEMYENLIEIQLKDNDIETVEKIVTETWLKKDDDMGPASNVWVDYDVETEELKETEEQNETEFQQAGQHDMSSIQSEEEDYSEQESERTVKDSDNISETVSDVNKMEQTLDQNENVLLEEDHIKTETDDNMQTIHEVDCHSEENIKSQNEYVSENESIENKHEGIKWDEDKSITDDTEILQHKENVEKHEVAPQTPCSEKINETVKQVQEVRTEDIIKQTPMENINNSNKKASESPVTDQDTNRVKEERLQRARELEYERLKKLEQERETERLRKLEEERERQIEREKDRMAVDRATLEAREKSFAETRERAAVERATAEFRQRALAEARERLEKACAEARERSLADKAMEGRLRVEKATAEARERAVADKFLYQNIGIRQNSLPSDLSGSYSGLRYYQAPSQCAGEDESPQRCKARLERHQRTADRAAKALAEKNMRDLIAQKEQAERSRLAEGLDAEVKRWSSGKQGNLRALLSTLQYILGPDSGWQPVPLTEVITTAAVKKAYRKATLCVHPDKLQQRGATIQQKYICEKVFDLLKEAWNKFNSEER